MCIIPGVAGTLRRRPDALTEQKRPLSRADPGRQLCSRATSLARPIGHNKGAAAHRRLLPGLHPVGEPAGLHPVGEPAGLHPVGEPAGLHPVGEPAGLHPVGEPAGLHPVGEPAGLHPVGEPAGLHPANLGFLLNILRVLVTKLHESSSNDVQKVRKAVRAALFLLPLLGITHSLEMFEPPLDRSVAVFGCYTIVLAVLDSFQGFYISLLYCFLNQEVRDAVVKQWHDMSVQRQLGCRRPSHIDRKASW
ncbi:Corticotropin-releasing factor receptor 1 [Amphibalanus amphitrite]|uniref:Corticotropin-releasing factor receptor 1 n=1 Tax=Amphibalanus amphitrite TaxID=1232801 RepID=A0A6A4VDS2_AMPAM|nr:Corticotropin-releasing factor receptor 1 [Amphibalanus amphitrite]